MANRIFKKTVTDEFGTKTTPPENIRRYLLQEGEKQFGEIKNFLEQIGIPYSNNKGLDLTLKRMVKDGLVGKHKTLGKYPTYHYKKKKMDDISSIATEFRSIIFRDARNFPNMPPMKGMPTKRHLLKTLIHFYGLYVLYTQIQSWKFTSKEKTNKENFEMRNSWLGIVRPIPSESKLFEDGITMLADLRYYSNENEFNETISKIYQNKKKWTKLLEIQKILKEMFPEEIEFFEERMTSSPKV